MTVQHESLSRITERAVALLLREMGPADTARFLSQFSFGLGDETRRREAAENLDLDDLISRIRQTVATRDDRI